MIFSILLILSPAKPIDIDILSPVSCLLSPVACCLSPCKVIHHSSFVIRRLSVPVPQFPNSNSQWIVNPKRMHIDLSPTRIRRLFFRIIKSEEEIKYRTSAQTPSKRRAVRSECNGSIMGIQWEWETSCLSVFQSFTLSFFLPNPRWALLFYVFYVSHTCTLGEDRHVSIHTRVWSSIILGMITTYLL